MDEIALQKTVTTKELADTLHVSRKTILENGRHIGKEIKNGIPSIWNEQEITVLVDALKNNNNNQHTLTAPVKVMSTALTPALKIRQAMQLAQEGYEEEIARIEAEKMSVTKERDNLQIELDESKQYMTVKRMEAINPGMHFNWRQLKAESERIGKPSKDVFDANYGTVKAYHVDVWEDIYYDSINYPQ